MRWPQRPGPRHAPPCGSIIVGVLAGYGAVIASLGMVVDTELDAVLLAGLGAGNGYLAITLFTWIQARTPDGLLGRTMSLLTFASLGLVSVSQAVSGALSSWDLDALFVLAGGLVLATTVWAASSRGLGTFTNSLTRPDPAHHMEES